MVVHQDQRRGAQFERPLDDLARIDRGMVDRALLLALVLDQQFLRSRNRMWNSSIWPCAIWAVQ